MSTAELLPMEPSCKASPGADPRKSHTQGTMAWMKARSSRTLLPPDTELQNNFLVLCLKLPPHALTGRACSIGMLKSVFLCGSNSCCCLSHPAMQIHRVKNDSTYHSNPVFLKPVRIQRIRPQRRQNAHCSACAGVFLIQKCPSVFMSLHSHAGKYPQFARNLISFSFETKGTIPSLLA